MPSTAEDQVPDFDIKIGEVPARQADPAVHPPAEDEWAAFPAKSKKKKKGKKNASKGKVEDEEDTPYAKSLTPSPPKDYGVEVRPPSPAPRAGTGHIEPPPPSSDFDDDTTAVEESELPPRSPTALSPSAQPLRPVAAKPTSPPVSPPYRPASLHSPPQRYTSAAGSRTQSSVGQAPSQGRESFGKQTPPRSHFVEAPPPHMLQAHFFGLPEIGLNLNQKQEHGKPAGSDGYCCRFDTFSDAGDAVSAKKARDALLVGSEGGLEVYRTLSDKLEVVGRLEGLRGGVIDAKVVPHNRLIDTQQALRPLVVAVVHGPQLDEHLDRGQEFAKQQEAPSHYETTVEIYSLQTQQHVATLYKSVPVPSEVPVIGHVVLPPPPVGDLRVDANGDFVTVASGKSGEIFVFSSKSIDNSETLKYCCIGKFWTALQSKLDNAARPPGGGDADSENCPGVPLLSLSHRWLAIVPPYSSTSISIQGTPTLLESHVLPPGLNTHTMPIQPAVTCEVAGVDAEGTFSWLSRKAAQGLVTASQRGYDIGMQGWRELTHPSPAHQRNVSRDHEEFPPTLAPSDDTKRLAKEPALVSIMDLQALNFAQDHNPKQGPTPLATFALIEGCNHLSFSPDGLCLLTSNRKGEVSTIWDLQHMAYGSSKGDVSSDDGEEHDGPHVRLLHRVTRSSPSLVIDSVWTRDNKWLAMLTAHGTVHLHEIASDPFSKKRKRQSTLSAPTREKAEPTVSLSQGMSPPSSNSFWGSLRTGLQTVSSQVNNIRSSSGSAGFPIPTTFAGFKEATAAAGSAGGRVVARGFSQGFNAAKGGASDMWHAEDNKIRQKALQEGARAGCLRWAQRHSGTSLVVACGGSVHLHPVQRATRRKGDATVTGLKQDKYAHKSFALPRIHTIREEMGAGRKSNCTQEGPHGFWSLRHSSAADMRKSSPPAAPPAPGANEVETNPPYCPFHIDPRVNILAFDDDNPSTQTWQYRGHGIRGEEPWCFGEPLPPSTKLNDRGQNEAEDIEREESELDTDDMADQMESKLTFHEAGDGRGQQIKINTRRSRRHKGGSAQEGGFDVLEDDESLT